MARQFESVDDYIGSFPAEVQTILQTARETIHAAAPDLQESISYGIPTFSVGGRRLSTLAAGKSTSASIRSQSSMRLSSRRLRLIFPGEALPSFR